MIQVAQTKPSGARTPAMGSRYARGSSGFWRRSAPRASGAAAYISTDELVTMLTRAPQLGNGSRKRRPMRAEKMTPKVGTRVRECVASKASGTKPFRLRPKLIRDEEVV